MGFYAEIPGNIKLLMTIQWSQNFCYIRLLCTLYDFLRVNVFLFLQ